MHVQEDERKDKPTKYSLNATIELTDCNHMISWDFGEYENTSPVDKIDAAIALLQEFRKKYIETNNTVKKLNPKE